MQEKKDLILSKYHDLICQQAFNLSLDKIKLRYTEDQINRKIDDFVEDLIKRGELFYGNDFVEDFINERTDEARIYLINDLKYGNGIDNKVKVNDEQNTMSDLNNVTNQSETKDNTKNTVDDVNIEEPKEAITYDYLLNKLLSDGWPEDAANRFLYDRAKDENIRNQAKEVLDKLENDEKVSTNEEESIDNQPDVPVIGPEDVEPTAIVGPMKVKTKDAKPGVLNKFKNMWKDPKKRVKFIVGAVGIAITVAAIALVTNADFLQFVSDIANNITGNTPDITNATDAVNLTSGVSASTIDTSTLDTSNWNMEGLDVYDSASEATNQINVESANQYFSNDIQGVYDSNTGQMLDLSQEDLQNTDRLKEVLADPNNSLVFGDGSINTLNDVSGFVNSNDAIDLIEHGRSR